MADTGIFATTAEVQRKVGANASATSNTEAYINDFMTQAESYINIVCKTNFSDIYTSLNVDVKGILKEWASCIAAMYVLDYDPSGMRLAEYQTRFNFLYDRAKACEKILTEAAQDRITWIRNQ